jgi:hypothetical protein
MSLKVTTKKNLIIFHDPEDWYRVLDRLAEDFGQAIRMRFIMKRELGFTARDHRGLVPNRQTRRRYGFLCNRRGHQGTTMNSKCIWTSTTKPRSHGSY